VTTPLTAEEELCPKAAVLEASQHTVSRPKTRTILVEFVMRRIDILSAPVSETRIRKGWRANPIKSAKQMSKKLSLGYFFYWQSQIDGGKGILPVFGTPKGTWAA
jgi:hypothetical protein